MAMIKFTVNGKSIDLDVDAQMPLLWVLRDRLDLRGTKYGCGIGECGACTVLMDGAAVRSCQITASSAAGKQIVTIEGLSAAVDHPLQKAWIQENVPQCGYCQPGQLMNAAGLLLKSPKPSEEEIRAALSGVLCRCGSYPRILKAVHRAIETGGV
jgi:aerobic-type carbon monoxide dehydrogenase small subunit (CoxS/CutS family)